MSTDRLVEPLWVPQTDPPRSPRETLPTMYDLPSEDPEEPGLPDEFHDYQPQLLRDTFRPPRYVPDHFFVATDMHLYYTVHHPLWHKRPDWFAVLGVPRLYDGCDLRMSYVIWQEGVAPYLVVELLSPGTEHDDGCVSMTQTACGFPLRSNRNASGPSASGSAPNGSGNALSKNGSAPSRNAGGPNDSLRSSERSALNRSPDRQSARLLR